MGLYCCGCQAEVAARLTDGREIYPHRPDLHGLPFWRCDDCGCFVGCHYKSKNRTAPLGCIPTPALRMARRRLHAVLDPLWQSGQMTRGEVYAEISARLGTPFHTAELRSIEDAQKALAVVEHLAQVCAAR